MTDISNCIVETLAVTASGMQTISTDNLRNGTYFVHIRTGNVYATGKLIIRK